MFDIYEFAAGTTFVKAATSASVAYNGGAGPTISSLTGTNWIAGAAGQSSPPGSSMTWSTGTEAVDTVLTTAATEGYLYGLTYLVDSVLTSSSAAATITGSTSTVERLMFAVNIPAVPPPDVVVPQRVSPVWRRTLGLR